MTVRAYLSVGMLLSLLASAAERSALAASGELESGVTELFRIGQHYSPQGLAGAQKQYKVLATLPGFDARVQYAFALVLIKQHRTDQALNVLDEIVDKQPDMLPAWRAKIWAQVSTRKYATAIQSMRIAAAAMAEKDDSDADERTETARFFGRVFGFLEGPHAHDAPAEELRKCKQRILSKLGADRAAFTAGEEDVLAQFAKLHERVRNSESTAAGQLGEREVLVKQEQKEIDKAEAEVEFDTAKLQETTETQLGDLTKEAESIQKSITQVQFQLNGLDQAIFVQQGQAQIQNAALSQRGAVLVDPARVAAIQQLNLIQNNLQQLAIQRGALVEQIAGLSQRLGGLVARRDQLLGKGVQESADLQTKAKQLKRKEKQLERSQKTAARRQLAPSPKAAVLTEQQQLFSTYEQFPFDREKKRALGWFH